MNSPARRSLNKRDPVRLFARITLATLLAAVSLLAVQATATAAVPAPTGERSLERLLEDTPGRFQVFAPGTIVEANRACATHFLVNPKGGKRLYALRGLLMDLDRYEGRNLYVRGLRLGTDGQDARCGGVPLALVYGLDTMAR